MILRGDCVDVLPTLDAESVDACVTDPPYNLTSGKKGGSGPASLNVDSPAGRSRIGTGFMGLAWDGTGVAFDVETWRAIFLVLKPGAFLVAFGGTRTSHRMTCAIEDAGFEIRDTLCWLYGSGFPKSLDVSKAIDKAAGAERERLRGIRSGVVGSVYAQDAWSKEFKDSVLSSEPVTDQAKSWVGHGTALKPAYEPIVLARKPTVGTVAANVLRHSTGALNIDACRIASGDSVTAARRAYGFTPNTEKAAESQALGRMRDRTDPERKAAPHPSDDLGRWPANVCIDEEVAEMLDAQSGQLASGANPERRSADKHRNVYQGWKGEQTCLPARGFDSGGASRFYYVAKPSQEERNFGAVNEHPTVKPVELMRWLVKLVVPVNGVCLDPFMGSGTTGMACRYEQRSFIGIERDAEYIAIAERRIAAVAPLFYEAERQPVSDDSRSDPAEARSDG